MLLWIPLALLTVGVGLLIFVNVFWDDNEVLRILATVMTVIFGFIVAIEAIVLVFSYADLDGYIAKNKTHYECLSVQYEAVKDDTQYTRAHYNLLKDIDEWNSDLARNQAAQHGLWVGPFIPDIYDQFDYITINQFMTEANKEAAQ